MNSASCKGGRAVRQEPTQTLSKKALPAWRIQALLESLFVLLVPLGYGILLYFFSLPQWLLYVFIVCYFLYVVIFVFIIPPIRWRRWRFEVTESEIDLKRGVWIEKRTLIPMTRVQHVDTEQGPLLRRYKLAVVSISTAATTHRIPALTIEDAEALRDKIAELAAVAVDE